MNLLDLIFPKYCVNCKKFGDFLCPNCFSRLSFDTKNICVVCGRASFDGLTHPACLNKYSLDGSFTCIVYNSISKKIVYQFKYKPHLLALKNFLTDLMYESLIQNEEFIRILNGKVFFIPIPLSEFKYKKRGYNQAEILAKELSKRFNKPIVNCLIRIKETKSQVKLNKKERRENIKGVFMVDKKHSAKIQNKHVILVDDVLTTGSTFSEAASVLKHCGVRQVWAVALAKED
jgi:ComF family protein